MDYHKDRYEDFSLMVFKDDKLMALLPANKIGNQLYSHQGLSYGGFLVLNDIRIENFIKAFKNAMEFLWEKGIENVIIKQLPFIYNKNLSGELDYILNVIKAKMISFDSYFVLDDLQNYKPNRNRKRALVKATENQLSITDKGIEHFWDAILTENLNAKFETKPVHTIDEIKYLLSKFPNNIKFFGVKMGEELKAGAIVFVTDQVAHIQYSSGDTDRDETSSLDFLFHKIIEFYKNKVYLSFGSSSTDSSLKINKGLAYWKESYGAKTITQEQFEFKTNDWNLLNTIFKC